MLKPGRQGFGKQVRVCALQCFELASGLEETRRVFATARLRCTVIQILTLEVQLLAFLVSLGDVWVWGSDILMKKERVDEIDP